MTFDLFYYYFWKSEMNGNSKNILTLKNCPVTGLPITTKPEWKYEAKDGSCVLEIAIIGESILYELPIGNVDGAANEWFAKTSDKIIAEYFGERLFYIVFDYTFLEKASLQSRKIFINWILPKSDQIERLSIFGMNRSLKIAVKTAKIISQKYDKLIMVDSYESAIKIVTENRGKPTVPILTNNCAVTNWPIITKPEWEYKSKNGLYSLKLANIGSNIILVYPTGTSSDEDDTTWFISTINRIIDTYHKTGSYYIIFDYTSFIASSLKSKKAFISWVLSIIDGVQLILFYGMNKTTELTIKTAQIISTKFEKIVILDSYRLAIETILDNKGGSDLKTNRENSRINELIGYLGKMTWRGDLNQEIPILPTTDSFADLFAAVAISQEDLRTIENERKKATAQLEARNRELIIAKKKAEESERLKTAFLNNMSHEIRTPLNGILGFLDLLITSETHDEKKKEYIEIIHKSSDRLIGTINDIMDMAKIEAGQVHLSNSKISLNTLIDELLYFFDTEAKAKKLTLSSRLAFPDSESFIVTDTQKLYGILFNLIKNAIKYTKKGEIIFGYSLKDSMLEFYVKDSGIGIPKTKQEVIFNRFEQVSSAQTRSFEGAGLGLAIAKAYVEMLGGELWLTSKKNVGSEFKFTIPYKTKI